MQVKEARRFFPPHSLIIEATTPAGGIAVFGERLGDLSIKFITERLWDALPWQDDNDDNGVGTMVPGPMAHQAQQLLFLAATSNHLQGADREWTKRPSYKKTRVITAMLFKIHNSF